MDSVRYPIVVVVFWWRGSEESHLKGGLFFLNGNVSLIWPRTMGGRGRSQLSTGAILKVVCFCIASSLIRFGGWCFIFLGYLRLGLRQWWTFFLHAWSGVRMHHENSMKWVKALGMRYGGPCVRAITGTLRMSKGWCLYWLFNFQFVIFCAERSLPQFCDLFYWNRWRIFVDAPLCVYERERGGGVHSCIGLFSFASCVFVSSCSL